MDSTRAHVLISGMVQGVFYRAFTRELAFALRLNGWVRNLRDGRVEALFEGDKRTIEQAIQQCYLGPSGARVANIEVTWEAYTGRENGFSVRF